MADAARCSGDGAEEASSGFFDVGGGLFGNTRSSIQDYVHTWDKSVMGDNRPEAALDGVTNHGALRHRFSDHEAGATLGSAGGIGADNDRLVPHHDPRPHHSDKVSFAMDALSTREHVTRLSVGGLFGGGA